MAGENETVRSLWQSQPAAFEPLTTDELQRRLATMERQQRRATIDIYVAVILSSIVIAALAAFLRHPVLIAGAALLLIGLGFLASEIARHRRNAPPAEAPSLDYQRALLRHRIEFHAKRLWLRVAMLAPGGIVFFAGLAAALPNLAPFVWFQLATFVLGVSLIVPMNRRAAAKLQRELAELDRLGSGASPR